MRRDRKEPVRVMYRGHSYTLNELAARVGLPKGTVWTRYINGVRDPEQLASTLKWRKCVRENRRPELPNLTAILSQFARLPVVRVE